MATPKKKISRSRRDKRRYSPSHLPDRTEFVKCGCGELVRPHRLCKLLTECPSYKSRFEASGEAAKSASPSA